MVFYIHSTVALLLSARTAWLLRDQSRANLNKIPVWTRTEPKSLWEESPLCFITQHKIGENEKCEKRPVTHLATSPKWMGHREHKNPDVHWVVASAYGLGAGTIPPRSSGQTDNCPHIAGRGGNDHRSHGPKVFLPSLLLPVFRKGRKGDEALHPVIS